MNLKTVLCFLLLVPVVPAAANVPVTPTLEQTLKRQADAWDVAIVKKDRRAVEANMADSFMQIDSNGGTADKKQFVEGILSADLTIAPYVVEDFKIRVYGTTAVMTGTTNMHGTFKGKPFTSHYRYTDVYVNEHGAWKVVNVQTTHIA